MRLHGLLCWYDEPVEALVACLTGLSHAGVEHVIAVDGAYDLYPGGEPRSPVDQYAAIMFACRELGMACTIHTPSEVWAGNETEKRTAHFDLAYGLSEPGVDWWLVMDADQVVVNVPDDFRDRLEHATEDVAETTFCDVLALQVQQKDWPPYFQMRNLFRADKIRVDTHHYCYITHDDRLVCGWKHDYDLVPHLDCSDLVLEHRAQERPHDRLAGKMGYYKARDESRMERGTCRCGQPAVRLTSLGWRVTDIGPVADWHEVCEPCGVKMDKRARYELIMLGIDPDSVIAESRNGHAPPRKAGARP